MEPADGETVIYEGHPSWRAALLIYVQGLAAGLAVGAIVWFAVSHAAGVAAALLVLLVAVVVGEVRRRATRYVVTDQRLWIRRGLLSRAEQHARLERVQDMTTRQSLGERLLGIGTVDFDTAGGDADEDFRFAGVPDPRAVVAAVDAAQRGRAEGTRLL